MPAAWSNKRERQYEHIKESAKKRGRSTRRAKEIAARTVNKQRSQAGETKSSRGSSSRGRSQGDERTKQELYEEAKKQNIEGRSKMSKDELANALGRS